jgi:hypothetical protein
MVGKSIPSLASCINVGVWLHMRLQAHFYSTKLFQPTSTVVLPDEKASFIGYIVFEGAYNPEEEITHLSR